MTQLSNDDPTVKLNQAVRKRTRNITAVYIRGCAFKCSSGGRRHQVLLSLKQADEKNTDLWVLKYVVVLVLGACLGSIAAYLGISS